MKKSLIALLLVVALVVTVSVFAVSATETPAKQQWSNLTIAEDGLTATGYCPHCCETTDQTVDWVAFDLQTGKTKNQHSYYTTVGHYFLSSVNADKYDGQGGAYIQAEVVLHLNGMTKTRNVNGGNNTGVIRVNSANGNLHIVDSEAQEGQINGGTGWAMLIEKSGARVTLHSGNIISTSTSATAIGNASNNPVNSATTNDDGGTLRMLAGTFTMKDGTVTGCTAVRGGAIYAKGSSTVINVEGGTITGGSTAYGGCIYTESADLNISGTAQFTGGTASTTGGAIAVHGTGAELNMTGGTVTGGSSVMGGNIGLVRKEVVCNISGGTVTGGMAPDGYGGNIGGKGQVNISDNALITNGKAYRVPTDEGGKNENGQGGNIYLYEGGALTMTGGTLSNTTGNQNAVHGGNIYIDGNNLITVEITGGTIKGGNVASRGGNIYIINGTLDITESTAEDAAQVAITNGSAQAGGAIFARNTALTVSGDVSFSGNKSTHTKTPEVSASGVTSGGAVIWVDANGAGKTSTATLSGGTYNTDFGVVADNATTITVGGTSKSYIWLACTDEEMADAATAAKVIVAEGFEGETKVGWAATSISDGVYGGQMAPLSLTQEPGYTGTGTIQALNQGRTGFPVADLEGEVTAENNQLMILAFAGVKYDAEGKTTETPLADLSGDLSAYDVIKLYTKHNGDATVEVPTDPTTWQTIEVPTGLIYDLNGRKVNLTITGEGKIDIIEPRTDDLDKKDVTNSKFTVSDITKLNRSSKNPATGYSYVAVQEMNGEKGTGMFTSNRVKVDITTVSIKPAAASLYYTTSIGSNAKVAPYVNSYGVVLSLVDMPTAVFNDREDDGDEENDNMYTELGLEEELTASFEESHRSCIVENILKDELTADVNTKRAELPIYANAFMCIYLPDMDAPIYVMADEPYTHSLKGLVEHINTVESLYTNANVIDMYKKFQNPMATWNLDKIAAAAEA